MVFAKTEIIPMITNINETKSAFFLKSLAYGKLRIVITFANNIPIIGNAAPFIKQKIYPKNIFLNSGFIYYYILFVRVFFSNLDCFY